MKIKIEIEVKSLSEAIKRITNRIETLPCLPKSGSLTAGIDNGIGTIEIITREDELK